MPGSIADDDGCGQGSKIVKAQRRERPSDPQRRHRCLFCWPPPRCRRFRLVAQDAAPQPAARAVSAEAMADYRRKLRDYTAAWQSFDSEASAYWSAITEKRRTRQTKRSSGQAVSLDDYVLTQPPVYDGPPRPIDPSAPDRPPPVDAGYEVRADDSGDAGFGAEILPVRAAAGQARSSSSAPMRRRSRRKASRATLRCASMRSRPAASAPTTCSRVC